MPSTRATAAKGNLKGQWRYLNSFSRTAVWFEKGRRAASSTPRVDKKTTAEHFAKTKISKKMAEKKMSVKGKTDSYPTAALVLDNTPGVTGVLMTSAETAAIEREIAATANLRRVLPKAPPKSKYDTVRDTTADKSKTEKQPVIEKTTKPQAPVRKEIAPMAKKAPTATTGYQGIAHLRPSNVPTTGPRGKYGPIFYPDNKLDPKLVAQEAAARVLATKSVNTHLGNSSKSLRRSALEVDDDDEPAPKKQKVVSQVKTSDKDIKELAGLYETQANSEKKNNKAKPIADQSLEERWLTMEEYIERAVKAQDKKNIAKLKGLRKYLLLEFAKRDGMTESTGSGEVAKGGTLLAVFSAAAAEKNKKALKPTGNPYGLR